MRLRPGNMASELTCEMRLPAVVGTTEGTPCQARAQAAARERAR
jgi:hypothetical protein